MWLQPWCCEICDLYSVRQRTDLRLGHSVCFLYFFCVLTYSVPLESASLSPDATALSSPVHTAGARAPGPGPWLGLAVARASRDAARVCAVSHIISRTRDRDRYPRARTGHSSHASHTQLSGLRQALRVSRNTHSQSHRHRVRQRVTQSVSRRYTELDCTLTSTSILCLCPS